MPGKTRHESHVPDRDFRPCIIFPAGLWWGSLLFVPPGHYGWRWGKIRTRKRWSQSTAQPSQGWATSPWRSLGRPPLWLFESRSPPGLYSSAPDAQQTVVGKHTQKYFLQTQKHLADDLTCPNWTLAASKPPTCSLFLKRSNGYVIVLLIIPAPLPQSRLPRFPRRGLLQK